MTVEFTASETKTNLMKAFAGESQARNRYTFAASQAKMAKQFAVEAVFKFTADQEKAHAEIFYHYLNAMSGETIHINGSYPVDITASMVQLLRYAQHNEYEEHDDVYQSFGDMAMAEGFGAVGAAFQQIAEIEKLHGDRFGQLADQLETGTLYVSDVECKWMCLNCGHVYEGTAVPQKCPVCQHDQGYFIRLELAPFTCDGKA